MIKIAELIRGPGVRGKFYRSRGGVWLPGAGIFASKFNVYAVVERQRGGAPASGRHGRRDAAPPGFAGRMPAFRIPGVNIVTDEGDKYYAQKAAGETPTNDFAGHAQRGGQCGTGTTAAAKTQNGLITAIAGSKKVQATGYPKTNDTDADNTGGGVDIVTWLHSYTKADFTGTAIAEFTIGIDLDAVPDGNITDASTADLAIMRALFAATFNKTADDTLKVFVNHTMNGV